MVQYVEDKLHKDWSPEQICGRLYRDYPHDELMRCSPETIYRWVYINAQHDGVCYLHLRRHHRRRRLQKRYGRGRRFLPGRVGIDERPEVVSSRSRFGDWEADLMLGATGKGALMTCLERKSRWLNAVQVPDKSAAVFNAGLENAISEVPVSLRQTLTGDNGKEMANFKDLEKATG